MFDLSVDKVFNDIVFVGGDLVFTNDISYNEAMRQKIKAYLKTFLGEWFLDDPLNPSVGIGYFQNLLGQKGVTIPLADSVFRSSIININGVTKIINLAFDFDTVARNLELTFSVEIADGTTVTDTFSLSSAVITTTTGASY